MHIQHVIEDYYDRRIMRFVWQCIRSLENEKNSYFLITESNDPDVPRELVDISGYYGKAYFTIGDPDCIFLHTISSDCILRIESPILCFQELGYAPPIFDSKCFAINDTIAKQADISNVFQCTAVKSENNKSDDLTIGLICDQSEEVGSEEGALFAAIGDAIPTAQFILPRSSDAFRAESGPTLGRRAKYIKSTEDCFNKCHISIFPFTEDYYESTGIPILNSMLSGSVPIVSKYSPARDYLPDDNTTYRSYHDALRICWRLIREKGFLDKCRETYSSHYRKHFSSSVFRKNMLKEIANIVSIPKAEHGS